MHYLSIIFTFGFLYFSTQINGQILSSDKASDSRVLILWHPELGRQDNKVDIIQDYIVDKLGLPHLRWRVRQAREEQKGIVFEMFSVAEAMEILKQAELLDQSNISIVPAMSVK
ncbi:unnamed protein product [Ceratitis capitata]|uniref:(Mediterranean fruit fly) hypothetical protein n=1 Tax=Ceratitis capitata TaxID=7213 RepID=A0A811UP46_CERCA|nr:unnamed protein product [Ceratitis capitata]